MIGAAERDGSYGIIDHSSVLHNPHALVTAGVTSGEQARRSSRQSRMPTPMGPYPCISAHCVVAEEARLCTWAIVTVHVDDDTQCVKPCKHDYFYQTCVDKPHLRRLDISWAKVRSDRCL
jgi:hypothetical protein